jgi:hypothetical protein
MIYALIDTNIYVRVWTQGSPGCELELFRELKQLAEQKTVRILLPEIVRLEIGKAWRGFPQALGNQIGEVKEKVKAVLDKVLWNEIQPIKVDIADFISRWKEDRHKACEERYREVQAFFEGSYVDALPFNEQIMVNAHRRVAAGKMPSSARDQDIFIVESVFAFLRGSKDKKPVVQFCSENGTDFGLLVDEKNKSYVLHPTIKEDLPKEGLGALFSDLASLVKAIKEHKQPDDPDPKEINAALEREAKPGTLECMLSEIAAQDPAALAALQKSPVHHYGNTLEAAARIVIEQERKRREALVTLLTGAPIQTLANAVSSFHAPAIVKAMQEVAQHSSLIKAAEEAAKHRTLPETLREAIETIEKLSVPTAAKAAKEVGKANQGPSVAKAITEEKEGMK